MGVLAATTFAGATAFDVAGIFTSRLATAFFGCAFSGVALVAGCGARLRRWLFCRGIERL